MRIHFTDCAVHEREFEIAIDDPEDTAIAHESMLYVRD